MPSIRNGFLWTCQVVGLTGTNGTYTGGVSGTNVDRSAVQWYRMEVGTNGLSLDSFGRIYDPAPTNAWWYYFPSLAVNCAGDMVAGFSGSSPTNYISALYSWRLSSGSILSQPRLIEAGTTNVPFNIRWGDYSATTLDPADDWSFWTVQEFAVPAGMFQNRWATAIARIRPNP